MHKAFFILVAPVRGVLWLTIPDVREFGEKWNPATLGVSMAWMVIFCVCMHDWTTLSTNTLGIPEEIAGFFFVAVLLSLAEVPTAIQLARQQSAGVFATSAVHASLFNILVSLPID